MPARPPRPSADASGAPGGRPPQNARTGLVVLLGDPVEHSLSPAIHNAAFQAQGLNLAYLACRVRPARLGDAVAGLDALGAVGANVTLPHKRRALELAATASPAAAAMGAANTLVRGETGWHADNTDVAGFLGPLQPVAERLRGETVLVVGAGGAARAVVWAAREHLGARVIVAARRLAQAEELASAFSAEALPLDAARPPGREAAVVVNATPVGMAPHPDATPWTFAPDVRRDQIAYDLVYRPAQTRFLRDAAALGLATIGGLPMLLGQAAAAYALWTGREMPLDAVRAALDRPTP